MPEILVGGQAVLEGVMMRAPGIMTIAVRRQNGVIEVHTDTLKSIADRHPWLRKPFFRGVLALCQALALGFKALNFSSAVAMEDIDAEEARKSGKPLSSETPKSAKSLSNTSLAGVIILTLVLGIGFFFLLPLFLTQLIGSQLKLVSTSTIVFNIVDGVIRIIFLLAYIFVISLLPDIRRVFQYHGAEHKAIHAYEAGLPLTIENARRFPPLHPRCGTAFLLMVMVVAILVFSMIPSSAPILIKAGSRIMLLPVIAALSFELIKKAGEKTNSIFYFLVIPGLWLQKVTTRNPDDSQLEVGLRALSEALNRSQPSPSDMIL
jgi:uncharacterized protein YqhQ